jgi:hypothetical protein
MMRAAVMGAVSALLVVEAGAALAQAGCPTAADLARGIVLEFADGSVETFRNSGPELISVEGIDADGFGYLMELVKGLHLLSYANTENGVVDSNSRVVYDYGVDLAVLPLPEPGGRWASGVTATDVYDSWSEPQSHVWGQMSTVDIGGCSYDMIEALISYKTGDGYTESVEFLPQLGLGYLVWNESDNMDRYPIRPVRIAVASKK